MTDRNISLFTQFVNAMKRIYAWPRLRVVLVTTLCLCLLFSLSWEAPYWMLISRIFGACMIALTTFGIFERWPRHIPSWMARWVLQVVMVAISIPIAVALGYTLTTLGSKPPWWLDQSRLGGFGTLTFIGLLIAPWMSVAALLKQIKNDAERQALSFDLARSQYEKQAINARLRLLQAQVEPHFLFNTLANVQELVNTGSPRASNVLGSLISYLRAAVPRLNAPHASIAQEIDMVRAYLEVMYMRMPDRLQFAIQVDEHIKASDCPPMTILTLVENAIRHGIDPAEDGGTITVSVTPLGQQNARGQILVIDTGIGMNRASGGLAGLGTGLANLRERLQLAFGDTATLTVTPNLPRGVRAEVIFPIASIQNKATP